MRTDLTASFINAKNSTTRKPIQLVVFKFPTSGNKYISDQPLGPADGLANTYTPLVEDWGTLEDSAGDSTNYDLSEIRQLTLTLWNGGKTPFSDYFLTEFPENVEVDVYQWFRGLTESDKALIDKFVIQDPISFNEADRLLKLDLVSIPLKYNVLCGKLLNKTDWPYCYPGDIGKGIPLAFGNTGEIPSLIGKTTQILTLKGSILKTTMNIIVYEDLDEIAFPTSGTVLIDEEKIRFSGRTSNTLTVIQRGYLSKTEVHFDKRNIVLVITDYTYLLCEGPVSSITKVKVDGFVVPSSMYTAYPNSNPARIVFNEKPWVKKFGQSTVFYDIDFDGVAAANTALQPAYAFDAVDLATGACIKPGNNVLAISQYTVNANLGEIVRVYLSVEHWEKGNFLSDYVDVWVSGIGSIGRLSRPNPSDILNLDADVDIDHPHVHETGGEHLHDFTQPIVATNDPKHLHSSTIKGAVITDGSTTGFPAYLYVYNTANNGVFNFAGQTNILSQRAHIRFTQLGTGEVSLCKSNFGLSPLITWDETDKSADQWVNIWPPVAKLYVHVEPAGVVGGYVKILELTLETTKVGEVLSAATSITSSANSGAVKNTGVVNVKNTDDVNPLATLNRAVNINEQDNPSRTIINVFELTNYVNFNWGWFTNREIRLTYVNTGEAKAVYILHAYFDIEYSPTEIVYSDKVTAEVVGLQSNPGTIIKDLLEDKAGVPSSYLNTSSFTSIISKYTSLGYRIDGIIPADITVKDAIKKICQQVHTRFFSSGGLLKLVMREGHPSTKPAIKELNGDDIQFKSIGVNRRPLREIANKIQLFFKPDWLSDNFGLSSFLESTTVKNDKSIAVFGEKAENGIYSFDLIRNSAMALKVANFYLMSRAFPSTFYNFVAYLNQFEVEKEDVLNISSTFNKMYKVPAIVLSCNRVFGSGKLSAINLFNIIAENLYYILVKQTVSDTVKILDILSVLLTSDTTINDLVDVIDDLLIQMNVGLSDSQEIAETLYITMSYFRLIEDSITVSDSSKIDFNATANDDVVIYDVMEVWSVYGFGSGGFGVIPFGGLSDWKQKNPDQIFIFEQLLFMFYSKLENSFTVNDALYINSGFGGKLSTGFGTSIFGK